MEDNSDSLEDVDPLALIYVMIFPALDHPLDKQRICVNTQLKYAKKQLK